MAITAMGWNQIVSVKRNVDSNWKAIKVSDYSVGIKNEPKAVETISGMTDKITWSKGLITVEGEISAPLTQTLGLSFLQYGLYNDSGTFTPLDVKCSISNPITRAYINTMSISAEAEQMIQTKVGLWGVLGDTTPLYYSSSTAQEAAIYEINTDAAYFGLSGLSQPGGDPGYRTETGDGYGITAANIKLEQVPMFDQVDGAEKLMPNEAMGVPISVSFEINNNLIRNYTLGQGTLDAFSVSAGQRDITGEVTWQSNEDGGLGYVVIGGTREFTTGDILDFGGIVHIDLNGAIGLYGATPPILNVSNKVTSSCRFNLLNKVYGFLNITIT